MSRKSEIKRLEKRLELLKSEEILMDRILEDIVEKIEDVIPSNLKGSTKNKGLKRKVRYRLQAIRRGTTVICRITDERQLVLLGEGIARCHIDDKFDVGIGFGIAQFRAKADWSNKSVDRFIDRFYI